MWFWQYLAHTGLKASGFRAYEGGPKAALAKAIESSKLRIPDLFSLVP